MQIYGKANKLLLLLITSFVVGSMTSCSIERKLGREYLKKKNPSAVLLLSPDFIYKSSFKVPDVDNFNALPTDVQDSLLFFSSDLVQYISDSVFFDTYLKGISLGLRQLGFTVYRQAAASDFINNGLNAVIVNLAQLQLEEFYDSISDDASYGDEENYNYELFINALNVNSWFELSRLNQNDTMKRILYSSTTYTDYFDGGFRYFPLTGDVKYYYTLDTLTVDQVYTNASYTGYKYAGYLFDYMMNTYISQHMPNGIVPEKNFTFDRNSVKLRKSKGLGFTIIQ